MRRRPTITREALEQLIVDGDIDTVVVAFPDLQGRMVGKRTTGRFFLEQVADGGTENCDYLIACDLDNEPVPGYRFASYDQGYGDMLARPDWSTVRVTPWVERTALVLCDLHEVDTGDPIEVAPRTVLRRQVEAAESLGYLPMVASEIEFYLFHDTYDEAHAKGYRDLRPHSPWLEDYHVLQTTKDEYVIGAIRRGLAAAGVPVEFSKGEAGRGQHEINLVYADALEMADRHAIYKNGAKEIAALNGRSITFMAKYSMDEVGSSCHLHSSVWDADSGDNLMWSDDADHHLSDVFRGWLGGIVSTGRELAWMYAHYVNSYKRYQPESWAPTALAWGHDNRTCGYRLVGHGPAYRVESRIPGADVNPYLAYAATIAAGLHGIEYGIDPPAPFVGNAYDAPDLPHVPSTLPEAIALLEESMVAKEAFGPEVHHHLVNTARQEWLAFNRAVTDWERRRNFEQI
jgi:glutamine synthetase